MGKKQINSLYKTSVTAAAGAPQIPVKDWTAFEGGNITRETNAYFEGGMRHSVYGGKATAEDITIRTGYDPDRDDVWLPRAENAVMTGDPRYTLTRQPITESGALRGKAVVYPDCVLVGVNRPNSEDGTSADVGQIELVFGTSGPK